MSQKIRVVLYMDANAYNANNNDWWASSKPPASVPGLARRYQLVVEIPDPRQADEVVRPEVTDVTEDSP